MAQEAVMNHATAGLAVAQVKEWPRRRVPRKFNCISSHHKSSLELIIILPRMLRIFHACYRVLTSNILNCPAVPQCYPAIAQWTLPTLTNQRARSGATGTNRALCGTARAENATNISDSRKLKPAIASSLARILTPTFLCLSRRVKTTIFNSTTLIERVDAVSGARSKTGFSGPAKSGKWAVLARPASTPAACCAVDQSACAVPAASCPADVAV